MSTRGVVPPGPRLERPVMRRKFRKELRARLMSEAAEVLAPRPQRQWLFATAWLRPALAAAVLAVLVVVGATSAAASSLPGDPLYGVKRASEDVQVALTFDDVARMQLLSDLTDRRLAELAEIAKERPSSAPTATAEYSDAVDKKHKVVLDAVRDRLPENAQPEVQRVIEKEEQRTTSDPGRSGTGGE